MTYTPRYPDGFVDYPDDSTPVDSQFLNAVEGALMVSGGSPTTIIEDGADVAEGTTTDAAWVSGPGTVISLLKKIASAGGSAVSIADGSDVAQGTTTDAASANTVVGLLKNLKAALAGTLTVGTHAVTDGGGSLTVDGAVGVSGVVHVDDNASTLSVDDGGGSLTVDGTVGVNNFPASQPVTGTFWQATQPTSVADGANVAQGTTTDLASANTVIGLLKALKASLAGTLTVATHAVTKSGTWPLDTAAKGSTTAGSPTSGALDANTQPLHVSLKETITQPVSGTVGVSGTVTADTELPAAAALADAAANPTTPTTGAANLGWNGTTWDRLKSSIANGLQVDVTRVLGTVTADVSDRAARLLGHVTVDNASLPVTGTFWQATQPVSGTVTADTEMPAAAALADAEANPTVPRVGGMAMAWNGTTWDRVPGTAAAGLKVQSAQLPTALAASGGLKVDLAGTGVNATAVKVDGSAVTQPISAAGVVHVDDNAASLTVDAPVATPVYSRLSDGAAALIAQKTMALSLPVVVASDQSAIQGVGNVASAVADSGNPVKTGGKATFPAIPTLVATGQRVDDWQDLAGAQYVRKRPLASYSAIYRLADATAAARSLGMAMTANTDKQIATIYHAAAAAKRVQVKYVAISLSAFQTATAYWEFEIQPLSATTAPATGNPAIIPGKADPADAAAEATCLALPTTGGSVVAVNSPVGYSYDFPHNTTTIDVTGYAQVPVVLWDSRSDTDGKDLIMRPGVAEGFAVIARANAGVGCNFVVSIIFTEE